MTRPTLRRSTLPVLAGLATLLAAPCVNAQVTHSVTASNTLTSDAGGAVDTIAAGTTLGPFSFLNSILSGLAAQATYQTGTDGGTLSYSVYEGSTGWSPQLPSFTGPNETLWVLNSAQPATGTLTITGSSVVWPSATVSAMVDLGDDGTVDWDLASGAPLQVPLTINGSFAIRVTTSTFSTGSFGTLNVDLEFAVDAVKQTYGSGCGLSLDSNVPAIGTVWDLTTTNIDPVSPFLLTFFGARGPAVPYSLLGLNAPGCFLHLSTIVGSLPQLPNAGSATSMVMIPNDGSLIGWKLSAQSLGFTTANAAGVQSSNGIEATFGN